MNVNEYIQRELDRSRDMVNRTMKDMTLELFNWAPPGTANTISATFIHFVNVEDLLIQEKLQDKPSIWKRSGWSEKTRIQKPPGIGEDWSEYKRKQIDIQPLLDYKDEVLKEFDLVVAAIHTGFRQSRMQLTKRITQACKNKYVHIIAHPTGRLWGTRDAYQIDLDEILRVARDTHTHLEINTFPERLDLNGLQARAAGEKGVKLALGTDAHAIVQLESMKLGVAVARRGWLTASKVLNTLPLEGLLRELKK